MENKQGIEIKLNNDMVVTVCNMPEGLKVCLVDTDEEVLTTGIIEEDDMYDFISSYLFPMLPMSDKED